MLNKLRTVRFTTKDLLIATMQCSAGLALLVLATNTHSVPADEFALPKVTVIVVGCTLFYYGIFRPFGRPRGLFGLVISLVVSLLLLSLILHRR